MVKPNRAELISIIAIVIAIFSAFNSYEQNELTKGLIISILTHKSLLIFTIMIQKPLI
jgi:hypothetical protein